MSKKPTNQVRLIGGSHKRRLVTFVGIDGLRPTPDRLRETLFNWLMGHLFDANVLDVCAGSGVLGFEALSRGAKAATLIELNKTQAKQLTANAKLLNINATILQGDSVQILPTLSTAFDVIFIDPPYAHSLWQPIIEQILSQQLLAKEGLLYIEGDRPLEQMITCNVGTKFVMIKSTKVGQIWAYLLALAN